MSASKPCSFVPWGQRFLTLLLIGLLFLTSTAFVETQGQTPPSHKRFTTQLTPFQMEQEAVEAYVQPLTNLVADPSFEAAPPNPYWIENDNLFGTPLCYGQADCGYYIEAHPRSGASWAWFGGAVDPYHTASLAQSVTFPACGNATLTFYFWIGYSFGGGADDQFFVKVDGSTVFSANATQKASYASYKPVSVNVGRFADGKAHTVEFSHVNRYNDVGFNLDDVSLSSATTCVTISGNAGSNGIRLLYPINNIYYETFSDDYGNYALRVPLHWSGAVTPNGYGEPTFVPLYRTYSNVTANQTGQNYRMYYEISGNAGVGGVALHYTDITPRTAISQPDGSYSFLVNPGWSGTVTPAKSGYRFSPASRSYSPISFVQSGQDYTAIPLLAISGNLGVAGATLTYMDGSVQTVASQADGSYALLVPSGWSGTVTPTHACFNFTSPSKEYTNVTSPQTTQNYTPALIAGCSDIDVQIGGANQGRFGLEPGASTRASFAAVNNGPVKIRSTNAVPLIGAERVIYKINNVNTSFTELMGLPDSQLDTTYWLPWYNNVDLDTQLRFANVSNATATVHVFIGGAEATPPEGITLPAGESTRVSYAGVNAGPVQIVSDQNIVAAERVIYKINNINTSFSEMMALPNKQLDTTYWLPWYNNVNLDTQLRIANVTDQTATVHVFIGTDEVTPPEGLTLLTGESQRLSYAGVDNGPVRIVSDQNIVAAERVIYKVGGKNTSFTEMLAMPDSQLDTTYWLPWYNNVDLDTQLRFANVGTTPATVHVFIGGEEVTPAAGITLGTGESTRVSYTGVNAGPVQIVSDQNIVAAERVIYKVNTLYTSFSEMMGLPHSLLDTTYWLPWYNNASASGLDTQLRFGMP